MPMNYRLKMLNRALPYIIFYLNKNYFQKFLGKNASSKCPRAGQDRSLYSSRRLCGQSRTVEQHQRTVPPRDDHLP